MKALLLHLLGMDNANGKEYLFWSGVGGDILTMLPIAWGVLLWYRHTKCHNCFRLGHHVPNLHWPLCKHHAKLATGISTVVSSEVSTT